MNVKNIVDLYPLSPMQQGMLYHSIDGGSSGIYLEQYSCRISGTLEVDKFEKAWQWILNRHTILRTGFYWKDLVQPLQAVHESLDLGFQYQDWLGYNSFKQKELFVEFLKEDRDKGFNISTPPLMRLYIHKTKQEEYIFTWSFHHLLLDAWSVEILLGEVFQYYYSNIKKEVLKLEKPTPYRNYIGWLQSQEEKEVKNFWSDYFFDYSGAVSKVELKSEDQKLNKFKFSEVEIQLPVELVERLVLFSKQNKITINTILQGAWAILLSRYSGGDEEVIFGTTASGRTADIENIISMVGLFINTLPVRVNVVPQSKLLPWLQELHKEQFIARSYEHTSLIKIKEWAGVSGESTLFDSLLVFDKKYNEQSWLDQAGLDIEVISNVERTNFPLTVVVNAGGSMPIRIIYDTKILNELQADSLLNHFKNIITGFLNHSTSRIADIPMLGDVEMQILLKEGSSVRTEYPKNKSIQEIFKEQVKKYPNSYALKYKDKNVTYQQLDKMSDNMAKILLDKNIALESLVGVYLERSIELIVCILGILKAGGAYLPLDPRYPTARLKFMLEEGKVRLLITENRFAVHLPFTEEKMIYVDDLYNIIDNTMQPSNDHIVVSDNLAYVMYSSGTTGQPKGICVTHKNIIRLVKNTNYIGFNSDEIWLQLAAISFDASTFEIWGALLNGATLVIIPGGTPSLREISSMITKHNITTMLLTTGLFHLMVDEELVSLQKVKQLITGGDILSKKHAKRFIENSETRLINAYGPTENTTISTCCTVTEKVLQNSVPIGRPIANTSVYILDKNMVPVPRGTIGELYVGGDGVARGYFQRENLTKEKFVDNPFEDTWSNRLYKTGDLVRYRNDSNIEFIGRADQQVKIRGFRIETSEIEATLLKYPDMKNVAVQLDGTGNEKRLIAYYVIESENRVEETSLKKYIMEELPEYMLPAVWVRLEQLPLNSNGKVDRKSLKIPNKMNNISADDSTRAPTNLLEMKLISIWEKILNHRPIGVRDNFFDLGGHSLSIVRLFGEIEKNFGIDIPISLLMKMPTIELLADTIQGRGWESNELSLVPLHTGGSGDPVFCIPPVGMTAFTFVDFSKYMPDNPVYAIQAVGLEGNSKPKCGITEIVSYYAKEIKSIQREGPYNIIGACYGSTFAFELAQQLISKSDENSMLIILDPGPVVPEKAPSLREAYRIPKYVYSNIMFLIKKKKLFSTFYESCVVNPYKQVKSIFQLQENISQLQERRVQEVMDVHLKSMFEYKPKDFSRKIDIFLSCPNMKYNYNNDSIIKQWKAVTEVGLEIEIIPGKHLDLLYEPRVQILAEKVKMLIDKSSRQ